MNSHFRSRNLPTHNTQRHSVSFSRVHIVSGLSSYEVALGNGWHERTTSALCLRQSSDSSRGRPRLCRICSRLIQSIKPWRSGKGSSGSNRSATELRKCGPSRFHHPDKSVTSWAISLFISSCINFEYLLIILHAPLKVEILCWTSLCVVGG